MSLKSYWWFMIAAATLASCCLAKQITYSQVGDMKVYNDGKFLHCDDLICPENAVKCVLSKETDSKDNKLLNVSRKCLDKDNKVLAENSQSVPNPYPGSYNSIYLESGAYGGVSTLNSTEAQKLAKEIIDEVNTNIRDMQKDLWESFRGF